MSPLIPSLRFKHIHLDPLTGEYVPSVGYRLYSFSAGSTSPLATLDESGADNSNPVILDSAGEADIRLQDYAYCFYLTDDTGDAYTGPTGEGNIVPGYPIDDVISDYAAAKLLIDALPTAPEPSTDNPLGFGTAAPGTSGKYADGAHIHPAEMPVSGFTLPSYVSGDEMITATADRDFSSDTGKWDGDNWTITGGKATKTANVLGPFTLDSTGLGSAIVTGKNYKITVDVTTTTAGALYAQLGGAQARLNTTLGTVTAQSVILTLINNTGELTFAADGVWAGSIDNVSLKKMSDNTTAYNVKMIDGVLTVMAV